MPDDEISAIDNRYPRVCRAVAEMPWAIMPHMLATIVDLLKFRSAGGRLGQEEIRARIGAAEPSQQVGRVRAGSIAIIPLHGVIMQRADMFDEMSGAVSLDKARAQLDRAVADPDVSSIILHIDSPGGGVFGVPEFADHLMNLRGGDKRIVASASAMAASAAYWIGAAADELVVTPSGVVGSIGVYTAHENIAGLLEGMGVEVELISAGKYKTEGHPFGPLDDEARAAIQSDVNDYYKAFVKAVASSRGVTPAAVRNGFGEGRTVMAQAAQREGMVDRVEALPATIKRLQGGRSGRPAGGRGGRAAKALKARLAFS